MFRLNRSALAVTCWRPPRESGQLICQESMQTPSRLYSSDKMESDRLLITSLLRQGLFPKVYMIMSIPTSRKHTDISFTLGYYQLNTASVASHCHHGGFGAILPLNALWWRTSVHFFLPSLAHYWAYRKHICIFSPPTSKNSQETFSLHNIVVDY